MGVKGRLTDLQWLYLAHHLEETFEGLEKAYERHLLDPTVRTMLEPLFAGGPGHRQLEGALARLNEALERDRASLTQRELLGAIAHCERLARDFYQRRADDLSDPALAELFRSLARDEERHLKAAEAALALLPSGV